MISAESSLYIIAPPSPSDAYSKPDCAEAALVRYPDSAQVLTDILLHRLIPSHLLPQAETTHEPFPAPLLVAVIPPGQPLIHLALLSRVLLTIDWVARSTQRVSLGRGHERLFKVNLDDPRLFASERVPAWW